MPLDNIEDPSGEGSPFGNGQQPLAPVLDNYLDRRGASSPAAMMLRERSMADREHMDTQRFGLAAQRMELEKVEELSRIAKEKMMIADQVELHRQTMLAGKALGDLDGTEPDYQKKLAGIMVDNPMAAKDPSVKMMIEFRNAQALETRRNQDALDRFSVEEGIRQADAQTKTDSTVPETVRADYVRAQAQLAGANARLNDTDTQKLINDPATQATDKATAMANLATARADVAASNAAMGAFTQQYPLLSTPANPTPKKPAPASQENPAPAASGNVFEWDPLTNTRKPVNAGSQVP